MGCGCSHSTTIKDDDRTRALVCHLCIYAEHGPSAMNDGAISCTIDGKPVVGRSQCPRGKWRHDNGVLLVRSLGIWHYGAAWWQRVLVWALKATHPKYSDFSQCGCIVVLKNWYNKRGSEVL